MRRDQERNGDAGKPGAHALQSRHVRAGAPARVAPGRGIGRVRAAALLIVATGLAGVAPAVAGDAPGGCWTGVIEAGPAARRVVFEFIDAGREGAPGSIHVFGSEIKTTPLTNASIVDGDVWMLAAGAGERALAFEGQPGSAAASVVGTISMGAAKHPLTLIPAQGEPGEHDSLEGQWSGILDAGVAKLRLVLELLPGPCGTTFGRLHSPDQGARNLPLSSLVIKESSLGFALSQLGAAFEGAFDAEHTQLSGTFNQGGGSFPLVLSRGDELAPIVRPQDPLPPFPYDAVDVTFENRSAGHEMAGTLTLPRGEGPFAAAVLVSGSGQQDRDESLLGHRPFLVMADRLTRAGIAVLRYDDRGVGGSGGVVESATSADFATDAAAAFDFLVGDPRIDGTRIGIVGHSEGGLIATMVAAGRDDVAFIVLWAGPGVTGREILLRQTELIMEVSGAGRPLIDAQLAYSKRFHEILASDLDADAAASAIIEAARGDLPELTADQRTAWAFASASIKDEQLEAQTKVLVSPWFRFFLEHDPRADLARVRCPVLGVWGSLDLQVESAQNLPEVARALARAGNDGHMLVTLAGLNHLLQPAGTGSIAEYGQIETTIDPAAIELMTRWISGVAARPRE